MPITRKQFELGIDETIEEWMRKIHRLLSQKRNEAFTEDELREAFSGDLAALYNLPPELAVNMDRADDPLRLALQKLVALDAVDARVVRGCTYYAYAGALQGV